MADSTSLRSGNSVPVGGTLPPGQVETRKFPVVGERLPPAAALDLDAWRLTVGGLVDRPLTLTYEQVLGLPQEELVADIHCVTGWTHFGMSLGGSRITTLLDRAVVRPEARFVRFIAYSPRDHDTTLALALVRRDTWLIHSRDGEPLSPEHGFPLRTVTPSRYFFKSIKWLRGIELLAEDQRGFWERESSYHDLGDPWAGDQRFHSGSVPPERLARFRAATTYKHLRGIKKILIGVDLRGWSPATQDLGDLFLKRCDLRDAKLAGCDLRGANLSLSSLRGADLRGADLAGSDLEGADFIGANLTDANLTDTALSATRFCATRDDGTVDAATVTGMRWERAHGVLETQEAYLRQHAATH